jgi:hypothetical protein
MPHENLASPTLAIHSHAPWKALVSSQPELQARLYQPESGSTMLTYGLPRVIERRVDELA